MENNFLEILDKMKLYMAREDYGTEEVNIPIEYFEQNEIIKDAVKNIVLSKYPQYTKSFSMIENIGFRIKNNNEDKPFLEIVYNFDEKRTPLTIMICDGKIDGNGIKIAIRSFYREIDKILNQKIADMNSEITKEFKTGNISRKEYFERLADLAKKFPDTAVEYMSEKAENLRDYHKYITDLDEYKEIFKEKKIMVHIAEETGGTKRMPSGRVAKDRVNEVIDFETRKQFLDKFSKGKYFAILEDTHGEEVYKAFIINSLKDNGIIIVMEPIDGEKTTFITFESNQDLEVRRELLDEIDAGISPEMDIVKDVFDKNRTQKNRSSRIISKYHVAKEVYERNLEYIITGDESLLKGVVNVSKLRGDREEMMSK